MVPFATLDAKVATHHADVAKAGAAPGRGLPADLAEARRARAAAAEDLADARAAHALLASEAQAAADAAEAAKVAVQVAARAVTDRVALDLVEQLRVHEAEAARLRFDLSGYSMTRTLSDPPLPHATAAVFRAPHHAGVIAEHFGHRDAEVGPWQTLRRALTADPDASLEPSTSLKPSN